MVELHFAGQVQIALLQETGSFPNFSRTKWNKHEKENKLDLVASFVFWDTFAFG